MAINSIWVFAQAVGGAPSSGTLELLTKARSLTSNVTAFVGGDASAIAGALISAHDAESPLLGGLASGDTIAAYAIDSGLTATRQGDKLVIRGEVRAVPSAAQASLLVLPVSIET